VASFLLVDYKDKKDSFDVLACPLNPYHHTFYEEILENHPKMKHQVIIRTYIILLIFVF